MSERSPLISVVVPVHNGGAQLERCLDALIRSDFHSREIIVVDDGSTDASADVARARGLEVVQLATRSGPAAARNFGARRTRGHFLLFVDADVVVSPGTLSRLATCFAERPGVAAVFGSYDDAPAEPNFVSQYKNLVHHYTHQESSAEAETFWAGCGAIRREAFEAAGGFDQEQYDKPSIEDIELGYRLRRRGFRLMLDRDLQVKHLKRWTLFSLIRTDVFCRAFPWTRLILSPRADGGGLIRGLNLRVSERASAALVGLAIGLAAFSYWVPFLLFIAAAALTGVFFLNLRLCRFFAKKRGLWFALRAFAMQLLYYFYSGAVFALCYCAHAVSKAGRVARLGHHDAAESRMSDA